MEENMKHLLIIVFLKLIDCIFKGIDGNTVIISYFYQLFRFLNDNKGTKIAKISNKELLKKECWMIKGEKLYKKDLEEMGQLKKLIYFITWMRVFSLYIIIVLG